MESAVHVCLVSEQLLANLIALLMAPPARVLLAASDAMHAKGHDDCLARLLEAKKWQVRLCVGVPSAGLTALRDHALAIAEAADQWAAPEGRVVLHATGGTKLQAMAFVEVFRELFDAWRLRIVYTDTTHQMVESLFPHEPPTPMTAVLDVPLYLAAQGMVYRGAVSDDPAWCERSVARKPVTKWLAAHCADLGGFLGALNRLAVGGGDHRGALGEDGRQVLAPEQRFGRAPYGIARRALNKLAAARLLEWDEDVKVRFIDRERTRYLGGVWLEEYAWHSARDQGLDDARCGVEFTWQGTAKRDAPRNEFDTLCVHANRLLAIECKTSRIVREGNRDQTMLTKLESLARAAGGPFGASLLLSARPLSTKTCGRARTLNIALCAGAEVKRLPERLRAWKNHATL